MVNNVTLVGRITRDPEVKSFGSGSQACNFTLAVNRTFKNQQGEYEADFINCAAFGNRAERMGQYVYKGQLLAVTGRIQVRQYDNKQGQRVYVTEVIASDISYLESNKKQAGQQASGATNSPYDFMGDIDIDDGDLPF